MRHYLLPCLLALSMAACGVNESAVKLLDVAAMESLSSVEEAVCTASADIVKGAGSFDLALTTSYFAWLRMESNLQPIVTAAGGDVIAGSSRNDWYASRIIYRYTSNPPAVWEDEMRPIYLVLRPGEGDADEGGAVLDFVQPKAAAQLLTLVAPGAPVQLFVDIQVEGALSSGQVIATNRIIFPITVYDSGFAGCGAVPLALTGPCGFNGQDGAPLICCVPDADGEVHELCPQ